MNNKKFTIWILGFVTLAVCSYFHFSSNRFAIANEKGRYSYKIDTWTGEVWIISSFSSNQLKIGKKKKDSKYEITKSTAILKVKEANILNSNYSNEFAINSRLKDRKGYLYILGWKAEKINDQVYLVSFEYEINGNPNDTPLGYYFELNTKANIIRNALSDLGLRKKYDISLPVPQKLK